MTVKAAVDELLKLKKDYKIATGKDYKPAAAGAPKQSQNPAPVSFKVCVFYRAVLIIFVLIHLLVFYL